MHTEIWINGKIACDSLPNYGSDPTYIQKDPSAGLANMQAMGKMDIMEHIGSFGTCFNAGKIEKDAPVFIKSFYNYTKIPGMVNLVGKPQDIMAIGMVYVGVPMPK